MILEPGSYICDERYHIDSFINEGGMQEVYKAFDGHLNRDVVIKVPKNPAAVRRFKRSAILSAKVNHPNVAKTLDYFELDNMFYLVEEFIDGDNLGNIRRLLPVMDPYVVAHIMHNLMKGCAVAHHVGVVHRDLKPSNIMIGGKLGFQGIKITDFGIAKMAEEELDAAIAGGEATITTSSTVMGALPYLSPEMVKGPRLADKPSDIWALASISYELLTGEKPFGATLAAVQKILSVETPTLPEWIKNKRQFSGLATEIYKIILSCFKSNPEDRPTANDMVILCEGLCYQPVARDSGRVKNYPRSLYGFITSKKGERVFFHTDSVYSNSDPPVGAHVWYSRFAGNPYSRAHPVIVLKE